MVTTEPMGWTVPSFPELSQRPMFCAVAMVSGRKHSPWANGACRSYGSRRKDAASPQRARLLWRPWPDRHLQLSAEQRWSVAAAGHSPLSLKDNFRPGSWGSRRSPKEKSSYSPLFFFSIPGLSRFSAQQGLKRQKRLTWLGLSLPKDGFAGFPGPTHRRPLELGCCFYLKRA